MTPIAIEQPKLADCPASTSIGAAIKAIALCSCLLLAAFSLGCGDSQPSPNVDISSPNSDAPLDVFVSNYPLQFFAERIGGDRVNTLRLRPAGSDPAFWRPNGEQIQAIQAADLIFLNGAGYETWRNSVAMPSSRVVITSRAARDNWIAIKSSETHSHGDGQQHQHGALASTTWLDADIAAKQVESIRKALKTARPQHAKAFDGACEQLLQNLHEWDRELQSITSKNQKRPIVFSHSVYQYIQRRYDLNGKSVDWPESQAPSEALWSSLKELLEAHPARWMIWPVPPSNEVRERLQKMGVETVVFNPCAIRPRSGSLETVMAENIEQLRKVYQD